MLTLRSSGKLTSDTQLVERVCLFGGVLVFTDGTNDAVITIYDVAAAGGAADANMICYQTLAGDNNYNDTLLPNVLRCAHGLYVTVSGTGASCIVFYN